MSIFHRWLRLASLVAMIACLFLLFSACNKDEEPEIPEPPPVTDPEPEPEPDPIYHPLTGLEIEAEATGRLFFVSVDNNPDARPHYGVSDADLIYELPAEGGIPRLMLGFYGSSSEKIGPVRSARPYFVNTARGWDAIFVHCGWSPAARSLLQEGVVDYLNEISYSSYFWRANDRYAPHNLFTSTELLNQFILDRELTETQEIEPLLFRREDDAPRQGANADRIRIKYPWADNYYAYDEEKNAYGRYIGESLYIDAANGEQLFVSNVIMQRVKSYVTDSAGRLSIDLCEGGEALLFSEGKVISGYWQRDSLDANTEFYDAEGNPFVLAPGLTWIQVCDGDVKVEYFDSTAPATPDTE